MNKKQKILELYREGKTVKDILKEVDTYENYIRTTIKNYKLEQRIAELEALTAKA